MHNNKDFQKFMDGHFDKYFNSKGKDIPLQLTHSSIQKFSNLKKAIFVTLPI